jgi:membrane protein DedA with SNARE-associated domain
MTLTSLLAQYGYVVLFAGCILEGETLLLLAGVAAHNGYLSFPNVVMVAFVGGTLGDQIYFLIGRHYGERLLGRWPQFQPQAERVHRMIERHSALLIVGVRFLYGLRLIGPVVIGMSNVRPLRFAVFNMLGALIWAAGVAGTGYVFGHAIEWLIADVELFEKWALVGMAGVVTLVWVLRWLRRGSSRSRSSSERPR